jgi:transposase-like protein
MTSPEQSRRSPADAVRARKPKKRLAPSEKWQLFVEVLTQQATQREAAEKYGVDRSTVVAICRTAKQGALEALAAARPGPRGRSVEQVELEAARAEIERLRATVTEQAVAMHLQLGKARWA